MVFIFNLLRPPSLDFYMVSSSHFPACCGCPPLPAAPNPAFVLALFDGFYAPANPNRAATLSTVSHESFQASLHAIAEESALPFPTVNPLDWAGTSRNPSAETDFCQSGTISLASEAPPGASPLKRPSAVDESNKKFKDAARNSATIIPGLLYPPAMAALPSPDNPSLLQSTAVAHPGAPCLQCSLIAEGCLHGQEGLQLTGPDPDKTNGQKQNKFHAGSGLHLNGQDAPLINCGQALLSDGRVLLFNGLDVPDLKGHNACFSVGGQDPSKVVLKKGHAEAPPAHDDDILEATAQTPLNAAKENEVLLSTVAGLLDGGLSINQGSAPTKLQNHLSHIHFLLVEGPPVQEELENCHAESSLNGQDLKELQGVDALAINGQYRRNSTDLLETDGPDFMASHVQVHLQGHDMQNSKGPNSPISYRGAAPHLNGLHALSYNAPNPANSTHAKPCAHESFQLSLVLGHVESHAKKGGGSTNSEAARRALLVPPAHVVHTKGGEYPPIAVTFHPRPQAFSHIMQADINKLQGGQVKEVKEFRDDRTQPRVKMKNRTTTYDIPYIIVFIIQVLYDPG